MANTMPKTKANNEPYRKVKITMWDDPKFRQLSSLPPSGQSLFIYLLTGPFTGIIPGLFKGGRAAIAEELNWDIEDFDLALNEALALGLVKADLKARVFWLPNAAKHNPPASVNVIKSWVRAFELLPECKIKSDAYISLRAACYGVSETMGMAFDKAMPLPKDKPEPLPSGIQKAVNSKQILKDPPVSPPGDNTGRKYKITPYPEDFETAWAEYPQRAGGADKAGAFKSWTARLREGVTPGEMIAGAVRYAKFIQATGKTRTEFVKQAKTFFGPSGHFREHWDPPVAPGRDFSFGAVSNCDDTIPPGFRG